MPSVSNRYGRQETPFERPSGRADEAGLAPVVLMVSGGADSTALLLLAATSELDIADGRGASRIARERLHVLHFNHQLRGMDAEEDEEFVRELCGRYGIPFTAKRADVAELAEKRFGGNVENAGRELRYAAANALANELSAQLGTPRSAARILTAHTADDRAETFLMNAIKGSAASGLSSIPRRRNRIVRPLLDRTHEELCELLRMNGIVWREDDTNSDTRRLRAFVRHEVLPLARGRNENVVSSLSTACDILSDEDAFMEQLASKALRSLERRRTESSLALDAARLAASDVAVARRIVRQAVLSVAPESRLESRHINKVLELVAQDKGSATLPFGVDVRVSFGMLLIRARSGGFVSPTSWFEVPGELELGEGRVLRARVRELPRGTSAVEVAVEHAKRHGRDACLLDAEAAGLVAGGGRLWADIPQAGDVLCPLGMQGRSKKLSDLLAEAKIPAAERAGVCIVRTSPTGPIIWVAGIREDERVRCSPSTKVLLELSVQSA